MDYHVTQYKQYHGYMASVSLEKGDYKAFLKHLRESI